MDDMRAIRSLVDTLRIPSLETRVGSSLPFYTDQTHMRSTGDHSRHVLRTFELEITGVVPNIYRRSKTDQFVISILSAPRCNLMVSSVPQI